MKNNKSNVTKIIITILSIVVVVACLFMFKSCSKKEEQVSNETTTTTIVVEEPTKTQETKVEEKQEEKQEEEKVEELVKDNSNYSYYVNFLNKDGSLLQRSIYKYGETPSFKGNTPEYSDNSYYYSFTGWDKKTSPVYGTQTYTALYDIVGTVYTSDDSNNNKQSISNMLTEPSNIEIILCDENDETVLSAELVLSSSGFNTNKILYKLQGQDYKVTDLFSDNDFAISDNTINLDFNNLSLGTFTIDTINNSFIRDRYSTYYEIYLKSFKINNVEVIDLMHETPCIYVGNNFDPQNTTESNLMKTIFDEINIPSNISSEGKVEISFKVNQGTGGYSLPFLLRGSNNIETDENSALVKDSNYLGSHMLCYMIYSDTLIKEYDDANDYNSISQRLLSGDIDKEFTLVLENINHSVYIDFILIAI